MIKLNKKMKSMLKAMTTKKAILGIVLFVAPLIGIAVSPEYAAALSENLATILQTVLDMLPAEAADAVVSEVSPQ